MKVALGSTFMKSFQEILQKHKCLLKDPIEGKVVTRFPPEPSGYLHIGHAKAAVLNYFYAKKFNGKMILRFDDTNPGKVNNNYVGNILRDVNTLGIVPDTVSHTSDYFQFLIEKLEFLINQGLVYADNTPQSKIKYERDKGIESINRNNSTQTNLHQWYQMLNGASTEYCIRAKMDMQNKRKCLRDPVLYRYSPVPHHKVGDKYKVYPCYDFACPLVDSLEGVTHALRTNEYKERDYIYQWVLEKTKMRTVKLHDFARVNFVNTILSKRKLQHFVDCGVVKGWDDPRMPTIQGIVRRGLKPEAIIEFMLEQGPSKNVMFMEWDKIWSINKRVIDNIAGRYSAISKEDGCVVTIENGPEEVQDVKTRLHPKNPLMGEKHVQRYKQIIIEREDANRVVEGEKVTLLKWGNCIITHKEEHVGKVALKGKLVENDKDFKNTKKLTWVPLKDKLLIECKLVEFGHLLAKAKIEESENIDTIINPESMKETVAYGEAELKNLKKGSVIQIERRGYFCVDVPWTEKEKQLILHYIPEGKVKPMSVIKPKINVKNVIKGT